ncbi:MAG: hypothetical protein VB022_08755 [Rikenellaceae bacterium]|nr:hypothetical protein [Rikenellaceae bacterium]
MRVLEQGVSIFFSPRILRLMGALGKTTAPAQKTAHLQALRKYPSFSLQKSCFFALAPVLRIMVIANFDKFQKKPKNINGENTAIYC